MKDNSIPSNPLTHAEMTALCQLIKAELPPDTGFLILVTPFPKPGWKPGDTRTQYAANIARESACHSMKEFLLKCGADEDWMRHLK